MKDRRRIKNLSGMGQLILDINPRRCDSYVYADHDIDVTNLVKYLDKRKEEDNSVTFFSAILFAIAKTIYNRKRLNYFVANRHLYEHTSVDLSFVAKVEFEDHAEEMMIIIRVEPEDTLDSINKKIREKIDKIRKKKEIKKEGANSAIDILGKLPNIIRVPLVGILKKFDSIGLLPESLKKDNLYYSSMILTDLGTFDFDGIDHHLSEFGTCSSIAAIGVIKDKDKRKVVNLGINLDERIGDGFYFIKSVKLLEYILDNPEFLDERADTKYTVPKKNKVI